MVEPTPLRPLWAIAVALVAVAFGIVTIFVGGKTLFGGAEARAAAGNIVPFVLWFNFVAGFAYIIAGLGLLWWKRWAAQLSAAIAVATMAVFIAFGIHIFLGGMFESRTVGAMIIRAPYGSRLPHRLVAPSDVSDAARAAPLNDLKLGVAKAPLA